MSSKVKRGLGLLVVALMAWLIALATMQVERGDGGGTYVVTSIALLVFGLAAVGCLLAGLVLLAWGLLRD